MITLPDNFTSSIMTNMGQFITNFSPFMIGIISVMFGLLVVGEIIRIFRK